METNLHTSFQTLSISLEERGYIRAIVPIMPLKSRFKKFVEFVGEVVG